MRLVLTLAALVVSGCMMVPGRYNVPQREYPPGVEHVSVSGFQVAAFAQTGGSSSYVVGSNVGGVSSSWQGEYQQTSDAPFFRHALENTRCVRRVDADASDGLRLDGTEGGEVYHGPYVALGVAEMLTLLPVLGVPYVENADGWATARLYRGDEYVKEYRTAAHFLYLTTHYTWGRDRSVAAGRVRGLALRDLADEIAADLCRAGTTAQAIPAP